MEEGGRAQTKPTFELLWLTYGPERRGGKPEARAAWKALPPDTDLAAVIEAAAAWRESWAAQNNPKAGRYTLAKWLAGERYEQEAPTGYQPKEKVSKNRARSGTMVPMTITDVKEVGDAFSNLFVTLTLEDEAGAAIEKQLHAFDVNADAGRGPDADSYFELRRVVEGGVLLGACVGVKQSKGVLSFHAIGRPVIGQTEPGPVPWVGDVDRFAPFGTFSAKVLDSGCEWNEHGQFVTIMLEVSDTSGGMEITRQVNHTFDMETARGRAFLTSICRAVGIASLEDTDVLHDKILECTITDRGEISYAELPAAMTQEAA